MADSENCPRCGKAIVLHGSFSRQGVRFRPEELRFFSLSFQFPEVPVERSAAACASCGLVWSELDPEILRQKLHDLGNEEVRQRLGLRKNE
jgi:hypothetical protein